MTKPIEVEFVDRQYYLKDVIDPGGEEEAEARFRAIAERHAEKEDAHMWGFKFYSAPGVRPDPITSKVLVGAKYFLKRAVVRET